LIQFRAEALSPIRDDEIATRQKACPPARLAAACNLGSHIVCHFLVQACRLVQVHFRNAGPEELVSVACFAVSFVINSVAQDKSGDRPLCESGVCIGSPQATADYAFLSLGGDKETKFKTAREDLIAAVFREVEKLGMSILAPTLHATHPSDAMRQLHSDPGRAL
jgi:hypothetical protein